MPAFDLPALLPGRKLGRVTQASFPRKWMLLLYWPLDFSLESPEQVVKLGRMLAELPDRIQPLGVAHRGEDHLRALGSAMGEVPFPLLADARDEFQWLLGVPRGSHALRLTVNVDPEGFVRWVGREDLSPLRPLREALRAIDAEGGVIRGAPPPSHGELLAMCAWCKDVRDEGGRWQRLETFVRERTGTEFTHGMCPRCFEEQAG
jgi:alkyl hydroperoxide reductase subunit AhpC